MSLHELKPCPFCGGQADKHIADYGEGKFYVTVCCSKCGAKVSHKGAIETATEQAVDAWNRRADDGKGNQAAPDDLKRLASDLCNRCEIIIYAENGTKSVNVTYDPNDPEAVKAAEVWRKALFGDVVQFTEPSEAALDDVLKRIRREGYSCPSCGRDSLRQAAEPLWAYLKKHGDPHTSVVVTQCGATVTQDERRVMFDSEESAEPIKATDSLLDGV